MPTYSQEFAEALVPAIYEFWNLGVQEVPSLIPTLFNVQTSTRAWEEQVAVGGMDPAAFLQYSETGEIGQLNTRKGYTKRFEHVEYPAQITIERRLVDDGGLSEMAFDVARQAGNAYAILKEELAADIFNNAISTNAAHALPDGKPLLATARPAGPSNPGNTWANIGTAAKLSAAGIRSARHAMMRYVDDRGQVRPSIGRLILVPPEAEETAMQIARSPVDTQYAATENPRDIMSPEFAMGYQAVSWPYLEAKASNQRWFFIDPVKARTNLRWYERVMPEIAFDPSRSNQVQICYSCYIRFSYGVTDARFIYGSYD